MVKLMATIEIDLEAPTVRDDLTRGVVLAMATTGTVAIMFHDGEVKLVNAEMLEDKEGPFIDMLRDYVVPDTHLSGVHWHDEHTCSIYWNQIPSEEDKLTMLSGTQARCIHKLWHEDVVGFAPGYDIWPRAEIWKQFCAGCIDGDTVMPLITEGEDKGKAYCVACNGLHEPDSSGVLHCPEDERFQARTDKAAESALRSILQRTKISAREAPAVLH